MQQGRGSSLQSEIWGKLSESKKGGPHSNQSSTMGIIYMHLKPSPNDRAPGTAHFDMKSQAMREIMMTKNEKKVVSAG